MGKANVSKGEVLHNKGDRVESVELILKGGFFITDRGDITLHAGSGTLLGAFLVAGDVYKYDYVASEDSTIFSYDYSNEDDLTTTFKANLSILPVMASMNMTLLGKMLDALYSLHDEGNELYSDLKANYDDYRDICAKFMVAPLKFASIESLVPPDRPSLVSSWQADMCNAYKEKDALLKKVYYSADVNFCIGTVMMAATIARSAQQQIEQAQAYIRQTKAATGDFIKEYYQQKAKIDDVNRKEAVEAGSGNLPTIKNALDTILAFAEVSSEVMESFKRDIKKFTNAPNQREKSDEMRQLRQDLSENFYAIYEAAFIKAMEMPNIPVPAEVKMFFLFGFVDEVLAGTANTAALYKFSLLWEEDPSGKVLTIYDWLRKIYYGEVMPSKNEFDMDWQEFLKEEVRTNSIKQEKADEMLDDPKAKVHFELTNMIATANRITHGSIFSFVPTFFAGAVVRSLESTFASPKKVHDALDKIRDIDFGCFYRPAFVSFPDLKVNRFDYNVEVLPYIILMPNFGSRGVMWQEIEGRKRTTPAHMVLSIFHSSDLDETITQMCAQFRWEMCRRIQGVRYSDITDPSLTSEYGNYLQFYKKNHLLTGDMKEKVKAELQRFHNNYKNVFVSDYVMYIKNEAAGLPRLTKVARDILFRYCTFSEKYRRSLASNPQYQPIMERWKVKQGAKFHAYNLFKRKLMLLTDDIPKEVDMEGEFLRLQKP